jgi:hypothetical protein
VCSSTGEVFIQSMDVGVLKIEIHPRDDLIASHIIHMNIKTERKEINEPTEEITFHMVKASG